MTDQVQPWGRFATLALGVGAMLAGQFVALLMMGLWYGKSLTQMADIGDGAAVTLIILVSTPVEIGLVALFASRRSANVADYLGLVMPKRSDAVFGIIAVIVLIVVANSISWFMGRDIVTTFQQDIYRTSDSGAAMLLLWLAVVIGAPAGEEILFRGFLFRGWLRNPRDTWPVIGATALLFALLHVQYDWFVMSQVFLFGLLLGFMRWVSGSTLLTVLMHALINFEGMVETMIGYHG